MKENGTPFPLYQILQFLLSVFLSNISPSANFNRQVRFWQDHIKTVFIQLAGTSFYTLTLFHVFASIKSANKNKADIVSMHLIGYSRCDTCLIISCSKGYLDSLLWDKCRTRSIRLHKTELRLPTGWSLSTSQAQHPNWCQPGISWISWWTKGLLISGPVCEAPVLHHHWTLAGSCWEPRAKGCLSSSSIPEVLRLMIECVECRCRRNIFKGRLFWWGGMKGSKHLGMRENT